MKTQSRMKILLIAGGWSSEREVSLKGAEQIQLALEKIGLKIHMVDPLTDMEMIVNAAKEYDFAFINMHGTPGEDGFIQAILETIGIPYNGSDSASSAIALNKYCAKKFFAKAGLNVLPDCLVTEKNIQINTDGVSFPAIFKPNKGGSSIYLHKIQSLNEFFHAAPSIIAEAKDEFLLETMTAGLEVTCPVLGNTGDQLTALPLVLIKPKNCDLFDFNAKYTSDAAEEICPAPIAPATASKISEMALIAHQCLKLSGYSRSDFIIPPEGEPIILEINTLPGMTPNSLLPKSAQVHGLSFDALLLKIIEMGQKRFGVN